MPQAHEVPSVSQLTERIKFSLAEEFPEVWVRGEIGDLTRAGSGHIYLALKDDTARISAVIWRNTAQRLRFALEAGTEVICCGAIDVYPPRGSYQLTIRQVVPVGLGPLQLAFQQLHKKLAGEGLFDAARKRTLPRIPARIVLVTSPQGAAVRDFLQVLTHRWPLSDVLLIPVRVQGAGSAREIAAAIRTANRLQPRPDVLALVRGGGSAEDLWSFNEEVVCRAIHESRIPVVAGVGHEVDVSLADLVADVRALTPTDAAERIVPKQADLLKWLDESRVRLAASLRSHWTQARQKVELLASRPVLDQPLAALLQSAMRLDELQARMVRPLAHRLEQAKHRCQQLGAHLHSLSPLGVLSRGYSLTLADGKTVRSTADLKIGQVLETRLESGTLHSRIEILNPSPTAETIAP